MYERNGDQFFFPLPHDDNGYVGRECPECEKYFKLTPGTGVPDEDQTYCPYCGHRETQNNFATPDQIEYAKSLLQQFMQDEFHKMFKKLERKYPKHKAKSQMVGFYVNAGPRPRVPIKYYTEEELETRVTCANCTLKYAVYGVFAFCPDCGLHNSQQTLEVSLEVISKMLKLAQAEEDDSIAEELIGGTLSNVVAKFDGFGREVCRVFADKSSNPKKAEDIRFQNLSGAQTNLQKYFCFDLGSSLTADEWDTAIRCFQKRHLLAHNSGVIDADYIKKANDPTAVEGRKVTITSDEVTELIELIRKLGAYLIAEMQKLP